VPAADSYSPDYVVALADTGEVARAEKDSNALQRDNPNDTLDQRIRVPQMKAAAALFRNRPEEAIADLEPAVLYDACGLDVPAMRGIAYLRARQPAQASAQFRMIVEHPFIDPFSANIALAHLGLARAAAMQHDAGGARREYETFLRIWKDADADLPPVKAARAELAALASVR